MARLYRPHIPIAVKVAVAERQFYARFPNEHKVYDLLKCDWSMSRRLEWLLFQIARAIECEVKELRLDHDPPLGARPKYRSGLGYKIYYIPDANHSDYLFYRPHGAQYEGSHDVKTRIRGDHGQFSDIALIKRARRRERGPKPKRPIAGNHVRHKMKWPKRKFPKRRKL